MRQPGGKTLQELDATICGAAVLNRVRQVYAGLVQNRRESFAKIPSLIKRRCNDGQPRQCTSQRPGLRVFFAPYLSRRMRGPGAELKMDQVGDRPAGQPGRKDLASGNQFERGRSLPRASG